MLRLINSGRNSFSKLCYLAFITFAGNCQTS